MYFFWSMGLLQLFRNLLLNSDGSWTSLGVGLDVSVHSLIDWKLSRTILQENIRWPGLLSGSSFLKQEVSLQTSPRLNMMSRARNAEKSNPVLAMHTAYCSTQYFSPVARGGYSRNFSCAVRIRLCPNSITYSCSLSLTVSVESAQRHMQSV